METWYVLEDGSVAAPRDVVVGASGVLQHRDGRAVAYAPHGPRTRSVDPEAERAKRSVIAGEMSVNEARDAIGLPNVQTSDMKPDTPRRGYRTRKGD
jgi:hypothetical protein